MTEFDVALLVSCVGVVMFIFGYWSGWSDATAPVHKRDTPESSDG